MTTTSESPEPTSEYCDDDDPDAPLSIRKIVGGGYDVFWNTRRFYRVVRGSKGSKKSKTTALWYIYHMMKYPDANVLCIRKVSDTLRDSCYADFLWAIHKLGVDDDWSSTVSPPRFTYKPTGQKILLKGLDKPEKLMSIGVDKGYLCWVWFEEASEITNKEDFIKIQMSIRGELPPETGLWKQITVTFNPWSERLWLKDEFFDHPKPNVFADVTTYKDNEFLGDDDRARYDDLYISNPRLAKVICDGEWGIAEGQIYTDWEIQDFDPLKIASMPGNHLSFGLDFGFVISYTAFVAVIVNLEKRIIWIYDQIYSRGMKNIDIAKAITRKGYGKERIIADSAETKSVFELQQGYDEALEDEDGNITVQHWELPGIERAMKGGDSVANGIQRVQSFHIIVHSRCVDVITELDTYCYAQDKDGKFTGQPIKEYDHAMDALRYALEKFFVHGHGSVVEAKGGTKAIPSRTPTRSIRVSSTL